jgi:hypothetical protein
LVSAESADRLIVVRPLMDQKAREIRLIGRCGTGMPIPSGPLASSFYA